MKRFRYWLLKWLAGKDFEVHKLGGSRIHAVTTITSIGTPVSSFDIYTTEDHSFTETS